MLKFFWGNFLSVLLSIKTVTIQVSTKLSYSKLVSMKVNL